MPIPFYMDHNVDDRITDGLRSRGIDVLVAREDGRSEEVDPSLLDRATELERMFYTHDVDFAIEGTRRNREGISFYGVVYSHQNANVGRCIESLEIIAHASNREEMMNTVTYIPM